MKKHVILMIVLFISLSFVACNKGNDGPVSDPLESINGSWKNNAWGGISNNPIVIKIDQNTKVGSIESIGSQTFNFSVGETILSNITTTGSTSVFNCTAIFKYGNGNQSIANTTASISIQNNGQQILIKYAATQNIQPPDYIYIKQ